MAKIHTLPAHIADMIAAGEVVERPASAAKELIENAIDAGAKNVTVELQNVTFLRVTDDGCGMAPEDAETAFLRHATSKLRTAEDLEAIHTLGFRGEALAAISAVSRIDLLTKTADAPFGSSLHLEAGVVTEREEAGCPNGTTIIVRDLFYNTPARLKFMKSDSVEASALLSMVQRQALAHPEVSIRLLRDGQEQLHTPGDGKLLSAISAVLGRQAAKEMVEVNSRFEKYALTGFVSKPSATRGNRASQLFFVNGRHIRSKSLTVALEEAYRNRLMVGRFPSCVLQLTLPENQVDVNVHPAKTEVKFLRERDVFDCVRYGVQGALDRANGQVEMQLPKPQKTAPAAKPDFFRTMRAEDFRAVAQTLETAPRVQPSQAVKDSLRPAQPVEPPAPQPIYTAAAPEKPQPEKPIATPEKPPTVPEKLPETTTPPEPAQETSLLHPAPDYRLVGEVFDTYILVEQEKKLLLIDKHAAHERILFEKFRARTEPIMPQLLLTPILCEPEREEAAILLENQDLLASLGYSISDYGGGTLAIGQLPAELAPEDAAATLSALAVDLSNGKRDDPSDLRDTLLHTIACKAAIKGGWRTDAAEREALVREVMSRDDIQYCPHGRPVCTVLTQAQLERQFKRS